MNVRIRRVGDHSLPAPSYETDGAAGFDLRAQLHGLPAATTLHRNADSKQLAYIIPPGEHAYFPVGFAFEIPEGYEMQVRPRSGLALRYMVTAWHPIGTVDSDYRGEVQAALHNRSAVSYIVWDGDRIAQGVIAPVVRANFKEVAELSETARGGNGFGSTGK